MGCSWCMSNVGSGISGSTKNISTALSKKYAHGEHLVYHARRLLAWLKIGILVLCHCSGTHRGR